MRRLQKQGVQLCTTPQVYREYLVVLTRGSIFERAFTVTEALAALEALRPAFRELSPTSGTFTALTHLVRRYEVRGKQVHDANIVAVMATYGMDTLATYNRGDFQRFEEVTLLAQGQALRDVAYHDVRRRHDEPRLHLRRRHLGGAGAARVPAGYTDR